MPFSPGAQFPSPQLETASVGEAAGFNVGESGMLVAGEFAGAGTEGVGMGERVPQAKRKIERRRIVVVRFIVWSWLKFVWNAPSGDLHALLDL